MAANKHRGEVEIELVLPEGNRKTFTMRCTWQFIAEVETQTGKGFVLLARRMAAREYGFADLVAIVASGLKAFGEPVTSDKVSEMVFKTGFADVYDPAWKLVLMALEGGEKGEEKAAGGK